jgi:hypothetical protein
MKRTFLILAAAICMSAIVDIPSWLVDTKYVQAAGNQAVTAQIEEGGIADILNWSKLAETASTSVVLLALVWLLWRRHIQQQTTIENALADTQAKYDLLVQTLLEAQLQLARPVPQISQSNMSEFLTRTD